MWRWKHGRILVFAHADHQRHITANATEEIKHDGFRALACVQVGECELVSRNGNVFRGFRELAESIGVRLKVDAVLDGKIVVLDKYGRSQFNDLLFRRGPVYFYAFDLLSVNGADLRSRPLIERKAQLRKLIRRGRSHLLYVDHIEQKGSEFFRRICELDLEGIVAKRAASKYRVKEQPSRDWIKIKNPNYSQKDGRAELFDELQGRIMAKAEQ